MRRGESNPTLHFDDNRFTSITRKGRLMFNKGLALSILLLAGFAADASAHGRQRILALGGHCNQGISSYSLGGYGVQLDSCQQGFYQQQECEPIYRIQQQGYYVPQRQLSDCELQQLLRQQQGYYVQRQEYHYHQQPFLRQGFPNRHHFQGFVVPFRGGHHHHHHGGRGGLRLRLGF